MEYKQEILFALLGFAVYLVNCLIFLEDFPSYFNADEAFLSLAAQRLIDSGGYDHYGKFLPTFFRIGNQYALGTSVYLQVVPHIIFGPSIVVVRATVGLVSALGAVWCALILKNGFGARLWWLCIPVISSSPIWLLFSRLGYEHSTMASFYAGFLYFYLRYRQGFQRNLYISVACAALSFYSHASGYLVVPGTALALILWDWRFHRNRLGGCLKALALALLFAAPLFKFLLENPGAITERLAMYGSTLSAQTSAFVKLKQYLFNYLSAYSPHYWFSVHQYDYPLFRVEGHSYVNPVLFSFVVLGLVRILFTPSQAASRLVLIAFLISPCAAATVRLVPHRMLSILVPISILSVLGLEMLVSFFMGSVRRWLVMKIALLFIMATLNFALLRDLLTNAYRRLPSLDFSLGGVPYGTAELFPALRRYVMAHPGRRIFVSPTWTWQVEELINFFLPNNDSVQSHGYAEFITEVVPDIETISFVLSPSNLAEVESSGKFKKPLIDDVVKFPGNKEGFFIVRLSYVENIHQVFALETAERDKLVRDSIILFGRAQVVEHSVFDGGSISDAFAQHPSLTRTAGANPLVIQFKFTEPIEIGSVTVTVGMEPISLVVIAGHRNGTRRVFETTSRAPEKKELTVLNSTNPVQDLRIEVHDLGVKAPAHVHIYGVALR